MHVNWSNNTSGQTSQRRLSLGLAQLGLVVVVTPISHHYWIIWTLPNYTPAFWLKIRHTGEYIILISVSNYVPFSRWLLFDVVSTGVFAVMLTWIHRRSYLCLVFTLGWISGYIKAYMAVSTSL